MLGSAGVVDVLEPSRRYPGASSYDPY